MEKLSFDESLKLCKKDIGNIYKIDAKYLQDMNFIAWLLAENPDCMRFIKDCINDIVGIDIDENMKEIAEKLYNVSELSLEDMNDPATKTNKEKLRLQNISDSAIKLLKDLDYYDIVVPQYYQEQDDEELEEGYIINEFGEIIRSEKKLDSAEKKKYIIDMLEKSSEPTKDDIRKTSNEYGPFGLWCYTYKENEVTIFLMDKFGGYAATIIGEGNYGASEIVLQQEKLSDFLETFFDKNNMEILNEFYRLGNAKDIKEYNFTLSELRDDNRNPRYDEWAILNAIDYLNNSNHGIVTTNDKNDYTLENGLNISLNNEHIEQDIFHSMRMNNIKLSKGEDFAIYDARKKRIIEQSENFEDVKFEEYLSILSKSVEDLPKVYGSVLAGTYQREDFLNNQQSKTPLQRREAELSKLEKEENTISEEEKLIYQRENDGQNK